jgi:hypothetical protein
MEDRTSTFSEDARFPFLILSSGIDSFFFTACDLPLEEDIIDNGREMALQEQW